MTSANGPKAGIVFNLQKYSLHDGPGIRTVVFLKGCPLRCRWCSNPESRDPQPELAYNRDKCLGFDPCGRCLEACAAGAIGQGEDGRAQIDRKLCNRCLDCAEACPSRALTVYGSRWTVGQVIDAVEEDGAFYARSGGGMTLSGGEPMFQAEFTLALLDEARRRRIRTAMETCGCCRTEDLLRVAARLDTLIYDLKIMDRDLHRRCTGLDNTLILENLRQVREAFPHLPILVRTPIVPGVNDSEAAIGAIVDFIAPMDNVRYEPLAYHRLGKPKYGYLDMPFEMPDARLEDRTLMRLKQMVRSRCPRLIDPSQPDPLQQEMGHGHGPEGKRNADGKVAL